jgi:tripartite-type tricarboxylate transporter receptor subunit TctC
LFLPAIRAHAQGDTSRPIRVIVPLPPGSSNDAAARIISASVSQILGQPILVDNKAGAAGVIGTMEVVRAKPDGLTVLGGSLSPLAANMAFVKDMPYDPRRDLTPIAGATLTNHVMVVAPGAPFKTFPEFIQYAKQNPGKASIGYSTSLVQLQIATIMKLADVRLLPVPYKGAPQSVTDVLGGSLSATMANPGPTIGLEKSGQLRVLGVTSLKRNVLTPDWPAISETLPGFDFPSWNAFVGPAGMAPDIVKRLSDAIGKALQDPEVIRRLALEATLPLIMGPEETRSYIAAEIAKFISLAKESGIQPE